MISDEESVSEKVVIQSQDNKYSRAPHRRTLSRLGLKNAPLIGGLCLTADFDQMWSEMCPSSEDFVSSRTSTKCGPILRPSLEDFVTSRTLDQIWSIMRPSLEDFVTSRTFYSNGNRQQDIQVETYSRFDCLVPLKVCSKCI